MSQVRLGKTVNNSTLAPGFISAIIALITGQTFGTLGGWEPILGQAQTPAGAWILAIFFGITLAQIYTNFGFSQLLPGNTLTKGVTFGFLVWVVILIIGAFWTPVSLAIFSATFTGIILHLIWGATLVFFLENWPK